LSSSFFGEDGGFTLAGYIEFFSSKNSLIIYWRTLRIGVIVTVLATLLPIPAPTCWPGCRPYDARCSSR
jgi:putative spermidine/putrescine transport system permease protein